MLATPFSFWKPGGPSLASEALSWESGVIANGGTASVDTVQAMSDFVSTCKAAAVWSKLKRVNLFAGDNLAACLVPLKAGNGGATETNFNFISSDYSEAAGLTGDGATKYLDTGFRPDLPGTSGISVTDCHLSVYNRSSSPLASGFGGDTGAGAQFSLHYPFSNGIFYADMGHPATARASAAISGPYGYLIGTRIGAEAKGFKDGVQVAGIVASGGTMPNTEMYVFAHHALSGATTYTSYTLAGYTIGQGLTDTDCATLSSAVEAFQDALGRGVA